MIKSKMRCLHFKLCTVLFLGISFFLSSSNVFAFSCDESGFDCSCEVDRSNSIEFQIKDRPVDKLFTMVVPEGYFHNSSRMPKSGMLRRGVQMYAHADRVEPWPRELLYKSSEGPFISMLVKGIYTSLATKAQGDAGLYSGKGFQTKEKFPEVLAKHELHELKYELREFPRAFYTQVFVSNNDIGKITDVLSCSVPRNIEGRYPQCSHTIETPYAHLKISYSRDLLPQWKSISRKARSFFNCVTEPDIKVELSFSITAQIANQKSEAGGDAL